MRLLGMRPGWQALCLAIIVVQDLLGFASAAVLAVDYGSEYYKAALVKPGIPFEIVLTRDSKRKEVSAIGFRGNERVYGADVQSLAMRTPQNAFFNLKDLLGVDFDSAERMAYQQLYPDVRMQRGSSDSDVIAFTLSNGDVYTVPELVAMQLEAAKLQAEKMAGEIVRDVVITVPPWFDEKRRQAMMTAAAMVRFNVLTLVDDGLATAVNFATSRQFPEESGALHVFYDMGAGGTSATLVKYSTVPYTDAKKQSKTKNVVEVLASASDRSLGGDLFTRLLQDHITEAFIKKHNKAQIRDNPRARAKIAKESTRVKQILSANTEVVASIESLYDDIDFRLKITRQEFEEMMTEAQIGERLIQPVQQLCKGVNVDSVVLAGGGVRVPFVQKNLENFVGSDKIAKSINADESAVMGAIFQGSRLSNKFKVRAMEVVDKASVDFVVNGKTAIAVDDVKGAKYNFSLNDIATRKDYDVKAGTDTSELRDIVTVHIANATEVMKELDTKFGCQSEAIMTLVLSESGLLDVEKVFAVCTVDAKHSFGEKVKNLFGGDKESSSKLDSGETETTIFPETPKSSLTSSASAAASSAATPAGKQEYARVAFTVTRHDRQDYSPRMLQKSIDKLRSLRMEDNGRIAREEARNSLEAYVYKVSGWTSDTDFTKYATDAEIANLDKAASSVGEWLYGEGSHATLSEISKKRAEIADIEHPISMRQVDRRDAPIEAENLEKVLDQVQSVTEAYENGERAIPFAYKAPRSFDLQAVDPELVSELATSALQTREWLQERLQAQDKLALTEPAILTVRDIKARQSYLESMLKRAITSKKVAMSSASSQTAETVDSSATESPATESASTDTGAAESTGHLESESASHDEL